MPATPKTRTKVLSQEQVLRRLFLTLFLRGRSSRGIKVGATPTSVGKRLSMVLAFYALFGMLALTLLRQQVFVIATYLHAMTFVMLGLFVATSAGEVLFNKEEGDILLHRPITPKALLRAKIGVMVQVSLWLAGAFNLAGFVAGATAANGSWLFVPVHAVSTVFEALFCASIVVLAYQMCLRWFGRERLDAFMTGVQVIASIALVLGGQLVPQLMLRTEGTTVISVTQWWVAFLPPAWFASIDDALAGSGAAASWGLAALGVTVTCVALWLAFVQLAGAYQTGLQTIAETPSRKPVARKRRRFLERVTRMPPLSWWLRDSVSRASFLLVAAYLLRDRDTKLRVYPGIAPMMVMPIIMLLPRGTSAASLSAFGVAWAGCYLGLVPLLAIGMLEFTQQWQASDVFRLAPMKGPGALTHGSRRAILLLVTVPAVLVFVAVVIAMTRKVSLLALLLPGIIAMPVYAMFACVDGKGVPLSRPTDEGKAAAGRGFKMLGVMMSSGILAGLAGAAYKLSWFSYMLVGEVILVAAIYWAMRARVSRVRWQPAE